MVVGRGREGHEARARAGGEMRGEDGENEHHSAGNVLAVAVVLVIHRLLLIEVPIGGLDLVQAVKEGGVLRGRRDGQAKS